MAKRRGIRGRSTPLQPLEGIALVPFLDLIFALIGIFVVVFALQEIVESEGGRLAAVDYLAICREDGRVTLYLHPAAEPQVFGSWQMAGLFERLARQRAGIRNLTLAFTGQCFPTQQIFEREFARFTALMQARREAFKTVFRLEYRPLSSEEKALDRLLENWRKTSP